ncbi:PadR family transcriptional regulator [Nonomuraea pusilla]|uniref:DNA-binding transcriptional regulator, PadR family n=1 Tax=Nonomuraea pusilla TaxID=46177 RepID=A0A1H8AA98_9ACTN|nr:PadR family transcriptional regulator [Nonomuraea pusilla]SEM67501.1 DNA-binding transcriptional regulator, PadR family [Nonomuraea pusilla]
MSLRIALLGLLCGKGPASGYDLTKSFERSLNHVWQAGHTQIYPELVKMTSDGLVTVESEGARGRKIYSVTPEGRRVLHEWLVGHSPSLTVRSDTGLQAFLLPLLDRDEAIAVVQRIRDCHAERLAALDFQPRGVLGRYALALGVGQIRSVLEWADETIADLQRS